MRLVGRILVVLGVAAGPTVVMLIGCNVDIQQQLPSLPNELPNKGGTPVGPVGTSTSSSGSSGTSSGATSSSSGTASSSSSSSGAAGPAQSVCDCAEAFIAVGPNACQTCEGMKCAAEYTTCQASDCSLATACVFNCGKNGTCIAACIDTYPGYKAFVECLYLNGCVQSCGVPAPITPCPVVGDAGLG